MTTEMLILTFLSNEGFWVCTGLYFKYFKTINVDNAMKKQLILYKYKAPTKNLKFSVANPKPAVHCTLLSFVPY